jgi:LL-diaminopimelate aminotransferase
LDVIFAIRHPDLPIDHIINSLCKAAADPGNHRYPETYGLPELCKAIADWYEARFGVILEWKPTSEVLPLIGSKEGIGHMSFCMLDLGDVALVPDPGYPVYSVSTLLAGGEVYYMPAGKQLSPRFDHPGDNTEEIHVLWIYPTTQPGRGRAGFRKLCGSQSTI